MFSRCFAYAHFTENILEDLPESLTNLGCILPTATKEKCEEETTRKNGIKLGKEIRNRIIMKKVDGIYGKSNNKIKTETLHFP